MDKNSNRSADILIRSTSDDICKYRSCPLGLSWNGYRKTYTAELLSVMTLVAVTVLFIDIIMKEKIGFGTVIDALLTGNFVQMFNNINPFPENDNLWLGIAVMLVGFVFMAIGMWVYMSAEQCCGPRDALLVGLGKRMKKLPIGIVEILLWGIVLLCGWLLGGPVGIGTLISTFGAGLVMQLVYMLIHFEPRNLHHQNFLKTIEILSGRK